MENPTVSELRSRSRSKTPFLRSSCDRESCTEGGEHTHHKSGRKTPLRRSTPIKQIEKMKTAESIQVIPEDPPAHRTRQATRQSELVKTSDYSSEESLDRLKGHRKEIYQNEINTQYERVSTSTSSQRYSTSSTLADLPFSPIQINTSHNVTQDRSTRYSSPAHSACSTDSSFAEQALADTSILLEREPTLEHLPFRLYKMAGEYWNKYPKTDYTYSPLSRDRVELAPGQVAVPNMSRRSLSQFRIQGPNTVDEPDMPVKSVWKTSTVRKRFTTVDSSDDESAYVRNGAYTKADDRWWITRLLAAVVTAVTTATSNAYRKVAGPSHRYPYTDRRPAQSGIASRAASVAVAPFYWVYTIIKTIVTTTVTTITETISPSEVKQSQAYGGRHMEKATLKRRWWPWILLLLLPAFGYGLHYTYENYEHLAMPNFTDFHLDLKEFTANLPSITLPSLPDITLPNLPSLPSLPSFNLSMPDINITLPDVTDHLPSSPEVKKVYREYKDVVQNTVADVTEHLSVVAASCWEEMRRFFLGVGG